MDYSENVLYMFNSQTGVGVSDPTINRLGLDQGMPRWDGGGTQIVERGYLDTSPDPLTADTMLLMVEATDVNLGTGTTTFLITDGMLFSIDDDGNPGNGELLFEFNTGPEIRVRPNPSTRRLCPRR